MKWAPERAPPQPRGGSSADAAQYAPGVLHTNFTRAGFDCGGNCGGIGLRYGLGGAETGSAWFVVPRPGESGVWTLRWAPDALAHPLPADALYVYVWASNV